ncbi:MULTISPECIES: photosystem II reaction center PsbP [unclassified Coleofasciculus]|uniref:photosystem II reaction center PsbP n=1 Tax=unclassified Coleofasciculus TaxID=2692782 RepID=UPI001882B8A7|nr:MULTISPECIES: photosystem II reaction center PsbP [unclassified Coleofasciculus]MBE9127024.1 photosystem II reaction center PsbP family protein [Coleofasciculus sp. LEGE 07081]MBE9149131.1 photosystem II reaction center PsbP family protein [Coleofasciculus sp. LEGE 07092]
MLKTIAAVLLLMVSLSLHGCSVGTSGLNSYVDSTDGYEFLYPNGWVPVKVTDGPDVVLHDLIEQTENVSVVINPVPEGKTLKDLGTPGEVGYQLQKNIITRSNSNRQVELVNAGSRESGDKTYYIIEYSVKLPSQKRHDLATAVVSRGKLYTLNASATELRWDKVQDVFEQVVQSFNVY